MELLLCKPSLMSMIFIFFSLVFQFAVKPVTCLQCYTCQEEDSNENCVGTNTVRICSRTQDRCLTQTIYSKERGKFRIDKYCASQAGCTQAEAQLDKKYFCDKSRAGWGCVECCSIDRCNESLGVQIKPSGVMVFASMAAVILYVFYSSSR